MENIKKYLKNNDVLTKENIISDKYIYSKSGIYIKQFNPTYDFYVEGNSKIVGNIEIEGNLILNQGIEQKQNNNFITLDNENNLSGIFFNDLHNGIFFENDKEIFTFGKMITNKNIIKYPLSVSNLITSKISINNYTISSSDNNIIISNNLKIDNNLLIKDVTISSDDNHIKIENINTLKHSSKKIESEFIYTNMIETNNSTINYLLSEEHMCKNSVIDKLIINHKLIINKESEIAIEEIKNIPNLSVNYINEKIVNNDGEIITTEGEQTIFNKKIGDNLSMENNRIINLQEPTEPNDAATKDYVDNLACGITYYTPVQTATTKKLDGVYLKSQKQFVANMPKLLEIDDYNSLEIGDRILVKNQDADGENGIYFVVSKGSKSQLWVLVLDNEYEKILSTHKRLCLSTLCENGNINQGCSFSISNQYGQEPIINKINNSSLTMIKSMEKKIEELVNELSIIKEKLKNN